MSGSGRRRRARGAVEWLETRWLFSLTMPSEFDRDTSHPSHGCGCGCPICGGLSGFVQAEPLVYRPVDAAMVDDGNAANLNHGGGCGCPICQAAAENYGADILTGATTQYVRSGLKWPQPGGTGNPLTITYSLSNLLTADLGGTLSPSVVYEAVEEALGLWAQYAPINFVEQVDSGPAPSEGSYSGFNRPNIRIGHHAIDGRNNVLAHAYLPDGSGLAGDVHLDTGETWTTLGTFNSIDIIEVLTHELGHSLGLNHEETNDAIMNPTYGGRYDGPGTGFLLQDDINGIRAIYGTGVGSVTPLPRDPTAAADAFTLDEDESLASGASVLVNDADPKGQSLTAVLATAPAHGELTLNPDGTFSYTPAANFFGEDSFVYRATNGLFESPATVVTLTVRPNLDLPSAAPDSYAVRTGDSFLTGAALEKVIEQGSVWRYLDDGSNQDVAWRALDFDDTHWQAGRAQLGYGDGDESTVVGFGGNAAQKHITTYFRQEIELTDIGRIDQLNLSLLRDDGAAVYVNGQLLTRSNLPTTYNYLTPAQLNVTGSSEARLLSFTIAASSLPPGTLQEGRNVIAVEVHQSSASSDDLSFDLALSVTRDVPDNPVANDEDPDLTGLDVEVLAAPRHGVVLAAERGGIEYTPTPGFVGQDEFTYRAISRTPAVLIPLGSDWGYLDTGADLGTLWVAPAFVEVGWKLGAAQLGYGDDDEVTTVASGGAESRFATTYFRKDFMVEDPSRVLSLTAEVLRDDAAAIYLNGAEVYRDDNLTANAAHDDYAGAPVSDENAFVAFDIPVELLSAGENVLAVEIHQASANDDDLSFDLRLSGIVVSETTTVTIDVTPTILGDVNFDGAVDINDLNIVRTNFGGDAGVLLGDADGDGTISVGDLNAVRNNFGEAAAAPLVMVATSVAPAPSSSTDADLDAHSRLRLRHAAWDLAIVDWLGTDDSLSVQTAFSVKRKLLVSQF